MDKETSHGQFVTLLQVSGVDDRKIDEAAQAINKAYMDRFRERGAITVTILELARMVASGTNVDQPVAWNYVLRYFGPTESVAFLQDQLQAAAKQAGGEVVTETFAVREITGRY
jgi:hypothetical protein